MKIADLRADLRALHHICRFNGHVRRTYSVAEHTAHGLDYMVRQEMPLIVQKAFALHDLPEAALGLGDINRDIGKLPAIAAYKAKREAAYFEEVAKVLDFDPASLDEPRVKLVDVRMGVAEVEAVALVPHDPGMPYDYRLHGWLARRIRHPGPKPIWNLYDHYVRLFGGTWK